MVSVEIDGTRGKQTVQMGFTGQRLTAFAGMALWSGFLRKVRFSEELQRLLPHRPQAGNAYGPLEIAMGFMGGILLGADKFTRISWLTRDCALAEVLGIRRMPSQSTFTRFFSVFTQRTTEELQSLYRWMLRHLPSRKDGYTLDLDSTALLHEDGHQEGVRIGYSRKGLKPCHHPLIAVLAEVKMVAGYWLRSGNSSDAGQAAELVRSLLRRLPAQVKVSLVRADSGFVDHKLMEMLENKGIRYVMARALAPNIKAICRHDDEQWEQSSIQGLEVQECEWHRPGQRLIVIRQRIKERPDAGGKLLFELPGYRYQALITNLPRSCNALEVWRTYNGRADCENRIKELGAQFGLRGLCCKRFWATEAAHQLAIASYNLCVLFQRNLGLGKKTELRTLRTYLFTRAGVWSRTGNRPTLKVAIPVGHRPWWNQILERLTSSVPIGLLHCNAAERLHT